MMERARPHPELYLVVAGLAIALHLRTLGFGFILDDNALVVQNEFLREAWSPLKVFAHHFWYGSNFATGYYRPLVNASFALNGRLLGWGPEGFHLVNVLLHAANAALLLALGRRLGLSEWAAGTGAFLFAIHPAAAWPVASVVARVDLLPAFFILLAWLAYSAISDGSQASGPGRGGGPGPAALCGLFFLCALLCKESAVSFLLVPLMGLRGLSSGKREGPARAGARGPRLWAVGAALVALAVYLIMRTRAGVRMILDRESLDPLVNPLARLPFPEWIGAALRLTGRYIVYLLFPIRFADPARYEAHNESFSLTGGGVLLAAGLLLAWTALALGLWLRSDRIAVPFAFGLAAFLPASNLLTPIASLYAQNFLYLPLLGLSLVVAELFERLTTPLPVPPVAGVRAAPRAVFIVVPLALLLAAGSFVEAGIWRDPVSLFTAWTGRFPNYALGHHWLGMTRLEQGDPAGAVEPLRKAVTLDPQDTDGHSKLSVALAQSAKSKTDLEASLAENRAALRLMVNDMIEARVSASQILLALDRPAEAEAQAREALHLVPDFTPARQALAESLFRQSRYKEAAAGFKELAALYPTDPAIRSPYVVSLIHAGDLTGARREAESARQAFPDLAWFDFCLARVEARSGNRAGALELLKRSLSKDAASTRGWIEQVEDFNPYRGSAEFEAVLKSEAATNTKK